MVKVSVVIPVYNVEDYLQECIDSIVNQTLEDIEIICINDGSSDNSLNILERFSHSDSRIKIFNQENKGVSASRNRGIKLAKGDYIYFMDSDDILDLNALEEIYTFSRDNDLDILIFKLISFYDETGEKFTSEYYEMPFLKPFDKKVFDYRDIGAKGLDLSVSPPGKLFKRDLINPIQFAEGLIFEDNLFFAEAFLKAKRISFLDRYFYNRRIRQNSLMTAKTIRHADFIVISNMIIDLFKKENVYAEYKKAIIEKKIVSIRMKLYQVDEEYREEYFQKMKEDFSNFADEYENDDVFKNELHDVKRYWFREALISPDYKTYTLRCDLYQQTKRNKALKKKQKKLKEKIKFYANENDDILSSKAWKFRKPFKKK